MSEFSNDSGKGFGLISDLDPIDFDPSKIMEDNLKGTALMRVKLPEIDVQNPIPEDEPGYLPRCMPWFFRSGDGCLNQDRPKPINRPKGAQTELDYLLNLAQTFEASTFPEMAFFIHNKRKRTEAQKYGALAIRDYTNKHADLPTVKELRENLGKAQSASGALLKFKSNVKDTAPYYQKLLKGTLKCP